MYVMQVELFEVTLVEIENRVDIHSIKAQINKPRNSFQINSVCEIGNNLSIPLSNRKTKTTKRRIFCEFLVSLSDRLLKVKIIANYEHNKYVKYI